MTMLTSRLCIAAAVALFSMVCHWHAFAQFESADIRISAANDPRFASQITLDPTPEQIAALVNDPRWQETVFGVTTPADALLSGAVRVGGIVDQRISNLSRSVLTGLDFIVSYQFEMAFGSVDLGLSGNYLFDFERQFIESDPLVEEVDTVGRPIDFGARANASWSRGSWDVSGFLNYVDAYTNNVSNPEQSVDSWTTVDLTISYDTGDNKGILSGTRVSLNAQNLFDEDPPFVDSFGGLAYDSANHNPLGRFVALQLTKEW